MRCFPCDHEYLNFRDGKLSKSCGGAVNAPFLRSKDDPDALPFCLTAVAPETRDTPTVVQLGGLGRAQQPCPACTSLLSTGELKRGERSGRLLGPQGVANRMLSFGYMRLDRRVPEPGGMGDEDREILAQVEVGFETVGEL